MTTTTSLARSLVQARASRQTIPINTLPSSEQEAYEAQNAVISETNDTLCGLKIGATNSGTQSVLGLSQPFFGPVFKKDVFNHNGNVPLAGGYQVRVETEFVIGIRHTLTGNPGGITIDDVMDAINWLAPGFELIGSRIQNLPKLPGVCAIADGGGSHNVVLGKPEQNWRDYDWNQHEATLSINGKSVASGHSGDSIAGSPIGMLHWLVNCSRFESMQLHAGQFVFCGTCTPPIEVNVGDTLEADFGTLGSLKTHCII